MKHCTRLHLPQPRSSVEEAVLGTRLGVWKETTAQYIKDNCLEGGMQQVHNLSNSERIGMNKLKKRIKAGELVVMKSDKGNKFTVSSQASYERQGDQHVTEDRKVEKEELGVIQARMNCLSRSLAKIVGLGSNWGEKNEARCWGNVATEACIAPLLYPSPKTHKAVDTRGDPSSRPIVQANSCVTSRPGELLANLLEGALLSYPVQQECKSTEEMLAKVDLANKEVMARGKDICVGSGDVVALYPSLRHKESAKMCGEMVRNAPCSFKNFDIRAAGVFVATNCTIGEIIASDLASVVPRRIAKRGFHPGPSTPEINTRKGEEAAPTKFKEMKALSDREERNLLAKVVEVGILQVMRNHVYKWKGETYLQSRGVPTGLALSGASGEGGDGQLEDLHD